MKKIGTVASASIVAFAVGAAVAGGLAAANAGSPAASQSEQDAEYRHHEGRMGHHGPGELVTGEDAQKAIEAATAVVAGSADRVYKATDGTYLVMVTTEEGTHVLVSLDEQFAVIEQREMPARGRMHGPGESASAEQTQKATDAVLARYPSATVLQVFVRDDDGFAVLMRTGNGHRKVVLLDGQYAISSVESPRRHHGKPGHHRMGREVTGAAFRKAEAAALQEVPEGTVMGVHKKGKKYHALVKKDDDSVVIVIMNSNFRVTSTKDMDFPRHQAPQPATSPSSA